MAELATIARPYAEALFRVAKSSNMNAWSDLVSEMAQVGAHPDVKALAANPNVSDRQVIETLLALLKSEVSKEVKNLVEVLVENDRVGLLPEIGVQFQALKNADQGTADAEIFSAFAMSDAQVAELTKVLGKKFGRKLKPTVIVDNSLIGGVRVVVGDEVYDTSIRAKLQQMHAALVS
ncbi:MAG: F0F1 ATP synthase subunit delta [Oxalobacter sp.]|jgi:F-type H+-transporting ATPase subunit delta|nr:MAG: F0F1 ATP synthase subunit delta [Oxalobacter sp.]